MFGRGRRTRRWWRSHDETYGALLGGCDSSDVGLRDELVLRLGLAGMRVAEIIHLVLGDLHLGAEPAILWIGRKARTRKVAVGPVLEVLLADWLSRYRLVVGRDLSAEDPVVCRQKTGGGVGQVPWGRTFKQPASIRKLVAGRTEQARLGHVSSHDLRRSAAGILHRSVSTDGAHHFDLLDIQKVLGHADPATTMHSYIDPPDTRANPAGSSGARLTGGRLANGSSGPGRLWDNAACRPGSTIPVADGRHAALASAPSAHREPVVPGAAQRTRCVGVSSRCAHCRAGGFFGH